MLLLRASLPQTDGTVALSDLEKPVRVRRDAHGIPSILATSQHDLYLALGFVHAQDRLFQMDAGLALAARLRWWAPPLSGPTGCCGHCESTAMRPPV